MWYNDVIDIEPSWFLTPFEEDRRKKHLLMPEDLGELFCCAPGWKQLILAAFEHAKDLGCGPDALRVKYIRNLSGRLDFGWKMNSNHICLPESLDVSQHDDFRYEIAHMLDTFVDQIQFVSQSICETCGRTIENDECNACEENAK